jgi:hypothetical protein
MKNKKKNAEVLDELGILDESFLRNTESMFSEVALEIQKIRLFSVIS